MKNFFCDINWDLLIKFMQVITTPIVAYLVYLFTKRNMRYETKERQSRFKYDKMYEAGMAFWGLLAYTGPSENKHTIMFWVKEKNSSEKSYYLHKGNAVEYMDKLNSTNYEKGYGLFLQAETRQLFYEYRNILYGFLLAAKNNNEEKVLVENKEMPASLFQLHDVMLQNLRRELKLDHNWKEE